MSFWWKDNRAIVDHLLGYNLTVSPEIKGYKPWFLDMEPLIMNQSVKQ